MKWIDPLLTSVYLQLLGKRQLTLLLDTEANIQNGTMELWKPGICRNTSTTPVNMCVWSKMDLLE
jgi:hypothetical protein